MSISVVDSGLAHNTGTTTASTITLTGTPQAGDLIVAQVMERNGTNIASHGSSSGYLQRGVKSDQGNQVGSTRWIKVLTTGETAGTVHTFTFSSIAAQRSIGWIILRSSLGPWESVVQAFAERTDPWSSTNAATTVTWGGFTATGSEPVTLVGFANAVAVNLAGGIPNPAGTTEVQETQSGSAAGSWRRMSIWYQHNVSAGAISAKTATLGTAAANQGGMIAIAEPPPPALVRTQLAYRFRADDGNETSATWLAPASTPISLAAGDRARIRFSMDSQGQAGIQNNSLRLQFSHNGGAWTAVTATSTPVQAGLITYTAIDGPTTDQLGGAAPFNPGSIDGASNGSAIAWRNTPAVGQRTEMEYCVTPLAGQVAVGDTVGLRLAESTTVPIEAYAVSCTLTVSAPVNTLPLPGGPATDEMPGALTLAPGAVTLFPAGLATDETTGTLAAAPGTNTLPLIGLGSDETVGVAPLTASPQATTRPLTGVGSDESSGTLTAVPQSTTRPLTGLSGDEGAGILVAVPQALTRPLTGLSSDETAPPGRLTTVPGTATRLLTGLTTDELPGTLTLTQPAANTIPLQGVGGDELAGSVLPVPQSRTVALTGASSDETTGVLAAAPQSVTVALSGASTDELPGTLTPTQIPPNVVPLVGAATDEAAGSLFVVPGSVSLQLAGLGTDELAGTLTAASEGPPVTVVPLPGVGTDAVAYTSLLELPQPVTVQLVGPPSDERPGRPYEPELGTPPPPTVLVGVRDSRGAVVGVRDPPVLVSMGAEQVNSARTGVRQSRGARLRVLETPRANVRGIEEKT